MATLAELEFENQPETLLTKVTDTVKSILSRKQSSDDTRFSDVREAVTTIAERVQTSDENAETRFSQIESELADVKKALAEQATTTTKQLSTIKTTLDKTENITQPRRKLSTGGDVVTTTLTDC